MVQKCPDGLKRVPNCQKKKQKNIRFTISDPFGPLWNVDKSAMFGHFCLFYWCVFWTPCIVNMQCILNQFVLLVAPTSKDPREYAKYKAEYDAYSDW